MTGLALLLCDTVHRVSVVPQSVFVRKYLEYVVHFGIITANGIAPPKKGEHTKALRKRSFSKFRARLVDV